MDIDIKQLLTQLKSGALNEDQVEDELRRRMAYFDLGHSKIDLGRGHRTGLPEVIYAEYKSARQVLQIARSMITAGHGFLATRLNDEQFKALEELKDLPGLSAVDGERRSEFGYWQELHKRPEDYHYFVNRQARTACIYNREAIAHLAQENSLKLLVLTAGTSDLPVALEACETALCAGYHGELISDCGVAGLSRLLVHYEKIEQANCIIVCAGMEGALASVVGGLAPCPVIAVPTSVGYGASFNGLAALLGMLNSCAPMVSVVNIDNGFGAAFQAAAILQQVEKAAG